MNIKSLVTIVVIAASNIGTAQASQFITGYDITNAHLSGWGNWTNTYTGVITSVDLVPYDQGLFNYTGGNGSLNDGFVTNEQGSQLIDAGWGQFEDVFNGDYGDNTSITLHFNSPTFLTELNIFSGTGNNYSFGTLTGASLSFGGLSESFESTAWGPTCLMGLCNARFSLAGTSLADIATDTLTLSAFKGGYEGYIGISEISISGVAAVSPVPEPETYAMLLAGLGLMGGIARRRKQKLASA